jgi:class 3 adenylate cyclase
MLTHRFSPHHEERRLVTVLFADVTGFTTLSEAHDPEEVGDMLAQLWTPLDTLVSQHGGRVDKHLGDSLMAVWGAPRATEEDAERAVTCALALQRKVTELRSDFSRLGYPELRLRIGLNSGSVLTSTIDSTGEYSVIGDVVNVAQRLQTIAPPGEVVVGANTYRLTRDLFRVRPLPPQRLKGKTAPVEAFLVLGPETRPARIRYRLVDSLDVRMVGRAEEVARLERALEQARRLRQPQLALIKGEAGIGKSRLLFEFTRKLELGAQVGMLLSARALAESAALPFFVWETMWANRMGMMKDEPEAERVEKFSKGILEVWGKTLGPAPGAAAVHVLGYLVGLDWPGSPFLARLRGDPAVLRTEAVTLMAELFRRAALKGPVVLVLDDAHHADAASQDLFSALCEQRDLPLLVVGSTRYTPEKLHSLWGREAATHVTLEPLALTEETIVSIFPRAKTLPVEFRGRLAAGVDGNPYFLEEVVKTLLQTGVIVSEADGWNLTGGHAPEAIPLSDSIRAQLQARLDAISPQARAVLLAASVAGRTFWAGLVESLLRDVKVTQLLAPPPDENWASALTEALEEIQQQELAFERRGSSFVGEREFIFKHNLLRETAYDLLPRKYRQRYHAVAAVWLSNRNAPVYRLAAAEHYLRAGEAAQAARHYRLAADYLRQRGYLHEAEAAAQAAERCASAASP